MENSENFTQKVEDYWRAMHKEYDALEEILKSVEKDVIDMTRAMADVDNALAGITTGD